MVQFLTQSGLPETLARVLIAFVAAVILVTFVAVSALIFIWLERKVAGRIQDRLGPTRVGGKFGWLQTLADGVKLICKEDVIPGEADHFLFRLAPYIAFCGSFVAFLALPFGNFVVAENLNVAVFFMLAVMSTEVFGVILAGYGSASKWSLFGGIREAAQMVSYEVPHGHVRRSPRDRCRNAEPEHDWPAAGWLDLALVRLSRSVHVRRVLYLISLAPRPAASGRRSIWPKPRANWWPGSTPNIPGLRWSCSSWPNTAACSPSAASPPSCSSAAGTSG